MGESKMKIEKIGCDCDACSKTNVKKQPKEQQPKEHKYPCANWLEERSCSECRQIAEERAYLTLDEKIEELKRKGLLNP